MSGKLDADDLADLVLSEIGDADLRAIGLGANPQVILREPQHRDRARVFLSFCHRALLTKGSFDVSSLFDAPRQCDEVRAAPALASTGTQL